jgi:hypothetical protein
MADKLTLDAEALAGSIKEVQRMALRLSSQLAFSTVPPSPEAQRTLKNINDTLYELREAAERLAIDVADPIYR